MRTVRVIPCLDVDAGRVVKGVNFVDLRDAGDPVELAARYDAEGADELVFLDITASSDDRDTMVDVVAPHGRAGLHPVHRRRRHPHRRRRPPPAAGGRRQGVGQHGRRRAARARSAEIADEFGAQCVVVAIDARRRRRPTGGFEVFTHGGRTPTGLDAVDVGRARPSELGAGEILLTSMDRDGTKDGFDLELTRAVADAVQRAGHRQRRRGHARPPGRGRPRGRRRRRAGGVDLPLRRAHRRRGQGAHGRPRRRSFGPCDATAQSPWLLHEVNELGAVASAVRPTRKWSAGDHLDGRRPVRRRCVPPRADGTCRARAPTSSCRSGSGPTPRPERREAEGGAISASRRGARVENRSRHSAGRTTSRRARAVVRRWRSAGDRLRQRCRGVRRPHPRRSPRSLRRHES